MKKNKFYTTKFKNNNLKTDLFKKIVSQFTDCCG